MTFGPDGLLAPNCILLVEWEEKFPRFRRDRSSQHRLGDISIYWI
jgi:hypothetical protein